MTRCVVFAGSSLLAADRPSDPTFEWRPPAAAGDLLQLLDDPPDSLCLIDGYFDSRPAVWHKEILLLIEAGVRVLGAASIGALRAAELDGHGMTGVGAIYRGYRSGRLHGDDEVALIHAPEELGWRPLSEPMVEVRATLAQAVRSGALTATAARGLRKAALSIHFGERDWPTILRRAELGERDAPDFRDWLATGMVRLKRADALLCLDASASARPAPPIAVPRTCFIRALALECGVALA